MAAALFIGIAAAVAAIHSKSSGRPIAAPILALIFALGLARGVSATDAAIPGWQGAPSDGERVTMTGWLTGDAAPAANGARLDLMVESVRDANGDMRPASFPVNVFAPGLIDATGSDRTSDGFRYGDVYEVDGEFLAASGGSSAESAGRIFTGYVTLTGSDRGAPVRRWIAGVREPIADKARRSLNEPAASLAAAMLVGDRAGLSEEVNADFRGSGTAHILAISGMHIALAGGAALIASAALFGRRRQLYLLAPALTVWLYAALAGFSPSVTRAAIMFSVYLLARLLGRQRSVLPALAFAAAMMVAISPEILRSLSFQLSFAAMAGIAILAPRLLAAWTALRYRHAASALPRTASPLASAIAVSLAATLATWPLIAINFGAAPIWGGLATLLLVPALPLFVALSGAASAAAMASPAVGEVIGWPAWAIGEYMSGTAALFAGLPPGPVETSGWGAAAAGAFFTAFAAALEWRLTLRLARHLLGAPSRISPFNGGPPLRRAPAWALVAAVTVAVLAWNGALAAGESHELTITFFETDRGDMVLIQTPNGTSALIDGGRHPLGAVRALDESLPFWDRSLDILLLTHADADHVGGLQAVLERYDVDTVIEAPTPHRSSVYDSWRRAVEAHGGSVTATPGMLMALDDGIALEVLSAGLPLADASINDASIVTILRYGDFSMLLTGDITTLSERRLLASGADVHATVLKVPHHGSATSSSNEFLRAVDPEIAIAQVGDDNTFGHPDEGTMDRLLSFVAENDLFVTSRDGDVTVRTDGHKVTVATGR
jgi:competence protein ComEC